MGTEYTELRPDKHLIDNNFDGYKLSLDPVPIYEHAVNDIDVVKLHEELYSYQHIKSFSLHNHLHQDPYNFNNVYYVNQEWAVNQAGTTSELDVNFRLEKPKEVFKIPKQIQRIPGHYNVTIQFLSPDYVMIADGTGFLYLLHSGERTASNLWKEHFSTDNCVDKKPFLLLHGVFEDDSTIHCLLLHLEERAKVENLKADINAPFAVVLEWITLACSEGNWSISRTRRIAGCSSIDYAALEKNGDSICIVSESRFYFIYDSLALIETDSPTRQNEKLKDQKPVYSWRQTAEDLSIWFKFEETIAKEDIEFRITSTHLQLGLRNGANFLEGSLFAAIDVDGSTWTKEEHGLEVTLSKVHSGLMWAELIKGDTSGEEILDEQMIAEVNKRLAHLTSDQLNPTQGQKLGTMNPQQLEECDAFPVDSYNLVRFNGHTHQVMNEIVLSSHQWLFSSSKTPGEMPAFCVRHDVDGLLWQPLSEETGGKSLWHCKHVATFNALGYVLASKQDKKFLNCSPTNTFAVLCDLRRHLYLYFQPTPLESDLRNRKTGKKVAAVAKQQVVTLDSTDVLGLHVSDNVVFVLTNEKLFVVRTS